MLYGFIYMTTNKINNKKYIGQKKLRAKDEMDYLGSGNLIKKAIEKYGRENFERDILDYAVSRKHINDLEKFYIEKYNAVESEEFYNISKGGEGGNNLDLSKYTPEKLREYKLKLSESIRKAHKLDPTISIRKSESLKGRTFSEVSVAKAVLSRKKLPHTQENIEKTIEDIKNNKEKQRINRELRLKGIHPRKGIPCPEHVKVKISEALKGKYVGENNPNYGRKLSEEARRKISEYRRLNPMSEESKERMKKKLSEINSGEGNPNYGNRWSEEQKKRLSEKLRKEGTHKGENNSNYGNKGDKAKNGVTVFACDKEWNEIKRFNTMGLALEFLGLKGHSALNKAIKNKTEYKGYYWKKERI